MAGLYRSVDQLDFTLEEIPVMPSPGRVLMVRPDHYTVQYVINPYMSSHVGTVDRIRAAEQWQRMKQAFRELGLEVIILAGQPGLPDMVFCANQSLPFQDANGNRKAVMSLMQSGHRKGEVPFFEQWFRRNGYEIMHLDPEKTGSFEGMGDALWHSGRALLWGGYGIRSSPGAYDEICRLLDVPVITLELKDRRFYHLDTCFCILDETHVLIYPPAFDEQALAIIHTLFEHVIEAPAHEAEKLLALNAACPDGKNVLIHRGSTVTNRKLADHGFTVHQLDTGEFLKSGGSVFCMKLLLW